eukprot:3533817-Pleurochrysis_carterae.AAC.1
MPSNGLTTFFPSVFDPFCLLSLDDASLWLVAWLQPWLLCPCEGLSRRARVCVGACASLRFVILLNVAAGCTFFQEWSRFRSRSAVAEFVLGIGCVVAGLWALSRHQQQKLRNAAPSASVVAQPLESSTDANLHSEMHVPMLRIDAARTSGTIQSISRVGSSSPLFEEDHPGEIFCYMFAKLVRALDCCLASSWQARGQHLEVYLTGVVTWDTLDG